MYLTHTKNSKFKSNKWDYYVRFECSLKFECVCFIWDAANFMRHLCTKIQQIGYPLWTERNSKSNDNSFFMCWTVAWARCGFLVDFGESNGEAYIFQGKNSNLNEIMCFDVRKPYLRGFIGFFFVIPYDDCSYPKWNHRIINKNGQLIIYHFINEN